MSNNFSAPTLDGDGATNPQDDDKPGGEAPLFEGTTLEMALRESEERFDRTFEDAAIGMALVSPQGRWLRVNRALTQLLGYSSEELLTGRFQDVTHPDDLNLDISQLSATLRGEISSYRMEKRYWRRDGHELWVQLNVSLVRNNSGEPLYFVSQLQDISERKRVIEKLRHDALHDSLTGLPNRTLFLDRLGLALHQGRRDSKKLFAVLFFDLDRFKTVNDSLGHVVGDRLLGEIGHRIHGELRGNDIVARLGGDEFAVLLDDVEKSANAVRVAGRLQDIIAAPFELDGREVFTASSVGIALGQRDYESPEEVLRDADIALHRAKVQGRGTCQLFNSVMHDSAIGLLQLETDLRHAVERNELLLHYQPIVSLADGQIVGFEALLRWMHSERELISPAEFIPVAEESGLIVSVGRWVLQQACSQMQRWHQQFPEHSHLTISVNVAAKQFIQTRLLDHVDEALAASALAPEFLKLEITESSIMESGQLGPSMLAMLRERHVNLQVDDFGTGYSSLAYLHRFPVDALKIDRSFIVAMQGDAIDPLDAEQEQGAIVRAIVTLARTMGLGIIAEGVETQGQRAFLQELGCEYGQGFLFARPLDVEAVTQLLREGSTLPR